MPLFVASHAVRAVAIDVFYRENEFVVEDAPAPPSTMAPASLFLHSIIPDRAMKQLKTLTIDVSMKDPHWRLVAGDVGPKLEGLRTLTIIARQDIDDNLYDFDSINTLEHIRIFIEKQVWPMASFGEMLEQFVVHKHSGAGSTLAGRDPRFEPTYFLEKKDLPTARGLSDGRSFSKLVGQSGNGLIRDTESEAFVEGIIRTSLVEQMLDRRF